MRTFAILAGFAVCAEAAPRFRPQEIQNNFGVVYAVLTADVNHDRKPDIVAINPKQVVWFENPSWTKHVVLDGTTKNDNVCISPGDADGDGKLDFAIGADWQPTNTQSGGSLQWIRQPASPTAAAWPLYPLLEEPTLHRIRWGDVGGDGKEELVVAPLHGRGNTRPNWEGQGARILVLKPGSDPTKPWPMEVADDSLHIVHNFLIVDGEIWTASREGLHALRRDPSGKWSKRLFGEGQPGEVKLGRVNRVRHVATVEPWHGNSIVVYGEPAARSGELWTRTVIETKLSEAHALGWGDFDGDGSDELAVGWRRKPHGAAIYKKQPSGEWSKQDLGDAVAVEDLVVEDLNGDRRPEIIAVGRATANVVIYWNDDRP
jgi:hypothetical protein